MRQTVKAANSMSLSKGHSHLVGSRSQVCEAMRVPSFYEHHWSFSPSSCSIFDHPWANPQKVAEFLTPFETCYFKLITLACNLI